MVAHTASKARRKMTMRARVTKPAALASGETDNWGHAKDEAGEPDVTYDALPCRIADDRGQDDGQEVVDATKVAAVAVIKLKVPLSAEVTTAHSIESVRDRLDRILVMGPMPVLNIQYRRDHLLVTCRQVADGDA